MRDKLKQFTDVELIQLATELRQTSVPAEALMRKLTPEGSLPVFAIIEINAHLTQELADRLAEKITLLQLQ